MTGAGATMTAPVNNVNVDRFLGQKFGHHQWPCAAGSEVAIGRLPQA